MEEKLEGSSSKDVHFTVPSSSSYKIKYYMLQVSRKKRATHDLSSKVACVNGVVNAAKVVLRLAF